MARSKAYKLNEGGDIVRCHRRQLLRRLNMCVPSSPLFLTHVVYRNSSLSSFAGTQFGEQRKFCLNNQHPQTLAKLQKAGFSYVRHDGIQPALGTAGYNQSINQLQSPRWLAA
jgi:hypothetical protein